MVGITALLSFSALLGVSLAGDKEAGKKDKGLWRVTPSLTLRSRDLLKRCQGTCTECFGSGSVQCPGSDLYCYIPGDPTHGIDSCTSDSSSAPEPSSTGSAGNSDLCTGVDATCVSCFGAGYLSCPDNINCYNPSDPKYDTCPGGSGGGGGGGSGSSCADQYGSGSVDCGSDSCYNPSQGDVCCSGGYHCENGDTCSSEEGYCCSSGSTSSGCSGSSSGGGLSSYPSYTSLLGTSTNAFNFATSTAGSSDASGTGAAQFGGNDSAASHGTEVKVAGFVLGMLGVGMLLL